MQVTKNKLPKGQAELQIELSSEEVGDYFKKTIQKISQETRVDGFRPGKVSEEVIRKKLGEDGIMAQAAELMIQDTLYQALEQEDLIMVASPKISVIKQALNNPFIYKATISLLPKVKLGDYQNIKLKKKPVKVEDERVKKAVEDLRKFRRKEVLVNREVRKGDKVEVNVDIYQNKIPIEGGMAKNQPIEIGVGHFIPGFEDKLVGMKKGEEKEFGILFPEDYSNKLLAGKKTFFRVKMKSIQKMELPEINDEFAHTLGKFENLNSLKESLSQGIKKEKELEESQRTRNEILEQIAQNSECELPESLVELEKNHLLDDLKQRVSQGLQISFEEYLIQIKKSEEEIKNSFLESAQRRVKNFLVLREVGKAENIVVSEEEIKEETNKILKKYSDLEDTEKKIDLDRLKDYTESVIYNEKVFERLENFSK